MKRQIKKVQFATTQNKDLNQKIQHKLYSIFKYLSNVDKHLKIENILSALLILIYISQCIYHLSINGFNFWYATEVFGLGLLYIGFAFFIKEGV